MDRKRRLGRFPAAALIKPITNCGFIGGNLDRILGQWVAILKDDADGELRICINVVGPDHPEEEDCERDPTFGEYRQIVRIPHLGLEAWKEFSINARTAVRLHLLLSMFYITGFKAGMKYAIINKAPTR